MRPEEALAEFLRQAEGRKLYSYIPYGHPHTLPGHPTFEKKKAEGVWHNWSGKPWQLDFHSDPSPERMLCAANQIGKTTTAAIECVYHATGDYPKWWTGKRFKTPVIIWIGSKTNEVSRDIVQKDLLGGLDPELLGTGWIPRDLIIGKPKVRQAGISDVVDSVRVRHVSGKPSIMNFKTYDAGWQTWTGAKPHVVWLDEEPSKGSFPTDDDYKIFTEAQTRTINQKGIIMVTFTPLAGQTPLVEHFHSEMVGTNWWNVTWDDIPHMDPATQDRLRASYPDYERDARTQGIPILGSGRVFTISEDKIKINRFNIPSHFARIVGIDFGLDHFFAAVWLAWDRDRDVLYVTDCYKSNNTLPPTHASAIKRRGGNPPVAWPHDGVNRDKASGEVLQKAYRAEGLRMLSMSARYDNDKGGSQAVEPVIMDVLDRMNTGNFKVFADLDEWFLEFRTLHRKDGRVVARNDDIMKATFYGHMMRRWAAAPNPRRNRSGLTRPIAA